MDLRNRYGCVGEVVLPLVLFAIIAATFIGGWYVGNNSNWLGHSLDHVHVGSDAGSCPYGAGEVGAGGCVAQATSTPVDCRCACQVGEVLSTATLTPCDLATQVPTSTADATVPPTPTAEPPASATPTPTPVRTIPPRTPTPGQPEPTPTPTSVPSETPLPEPTATNPPPATEKPKCNHGGGNGPDGCDPGRDPTQANNDGDHTPEP